MPKILGNGLGEYNKSCSAPHQESSKIEFAIFQICYDFSSDFTRFSNLHSLLKIHFTPRTLQRSKVLQPYPRFAVNTLERGGGLQCGPWPWGWRGTANSGEADGAPGRAGARGGG
jgi:hypothetical protein